MSKEFGKINFSSKEKKIKPLDPANYVFKYGHLKKADGSRNLNSIEQQTLEFCLHLTEKEGWVCVDYEYLCNKLNRCRETVRDILKAISKHIHWRYERSVRIDGKKIYNVIIIERIAK